MALANIGKMASMILFNCLLIHVSECFPTKVRSVALGSSAMASRVGAMAAPFLKQIVGSDLFFLPTRFVRTSCYNDDQRIRALHVYKLIAGEFENFSGSHNGTMGSTMHHDIRVCDRGTALASPAGDIRKQTTGYIPRSQTDSAES